MANGISYACGISSETGEIVISGGTITAGSANGHEYAGIYGPSGITITGGSVTAFGTEWALITYEGYGTITIELPMYKHRTNTVLYTARLPVSSEDAPEDYSPLRKPLTAPRSQ